MSDPANDWGDAPASSPNDWGDHPAAAAAANPSLNATISAPPTPSGPGGHVARWAQNVMDDIRYGTDLTGVGTVLNKLGAHGVYNGAPEKVGEFMASLPLGIARAVKGAGETHEPGQLGQGVKDMAGGALQASEMPLSFVNPEGAGAGHAGGAIEAAGQAKKGATIAVRSLTDLLPSVERAGKNFDEVMEAAGHIPINVTNPGNTALRIQDLAASGGSMPKVVRDFIRRVTDPDKAALTYKEARDFYSNATRLSADETNRLTPIMKRQVGQFTADLKQSIGEASDQVGKLQQYHDAMQEYHSAMRLRDWKEDLKGLATSTLAKGAAGAGGGAAAAYGVKKLLQ